MQMRLTGVRPVTPLVSHRIYECCFHKVLHHSNQRGPMGSTFSICSSSVTNNDGRGRRTRSALYRSTSSSALWFWKVCNALPLVDRRKARFQSGGLWQQSISQLLSYGWLTGALEHIDIRPGRTDGRKVLRKNRAKLFINWPNMEPEEIFSFPGRETRRWESIFGNVDHVECFSIWRRYRDFLYYTSSGLWKVCYSSLFSRFD